MRIRQVKPAFFKDARMAELTADERLFFIGLWMLADDAGYLRWDPAEAGLELYGYEPRDEREQAATAHLAVLIEAGRVVNLECGHLRIPTFKNHQRLAGLSKQVKTYENEHHACYAPAPPAGARDDPTSPGPERSGKGIGSGTERFGSELVRAPASSGAGATSAFSQAVGPVVALHRCSCGKRMVQAGSGRWVCTNPDRSRCDVALAIAQA